MRAPAPCTVIFQAWSKPLRDFVADPCGRFEIPTRAGSGSMQSALEYWIEVKLKMAKAFFQDWTKFDAAGVLLISCVFKREFGDQPPIHWPGPGARDIKVGQQAPPGV